MLIKGYMCTGNIELLEAAGACYEVLQVGGRPDGEVAAEFYIGVLGGRLHIYNE
jgi:hypothetical protein